MSKGGVTVRELMGEPMLGTLGQLEQFEAFVRVDNDEELMKYQRARADIKAKHDALRTKIRTN